MNKVILLGRLTRNPDVRYTTSANPMAIARFTLAVDRRFKKDGEQNADFISCTAFGKQAEFCEKYLKQGTKIVCAGRIQTGSYMKGDSRVYTTDVVIEEIEFAESKSTSENSGQNTSYAKPSKIQNYSNQNNKNKNMPVYHQEEGFLQIPVGMEDELPFL